MMPSPEMQLDMSEVRLSQARRLQSGARVSAIVVTVTIIYVALLMFAADRSGMAWLWLAVSLFMVCVTLLYARYRFPRGITLENHRAYLRGHVVITLMTAIVWSTSAILISDFDSYAAMFTAASIACTITAGGMLPGSDYRPAYITLSVGTLLPVSFYLIVFAPTPIRYIGIPLLLYFGFGLLMSAKAEINSRDGIIARARQKLLDASSEQIRQLEQSNAEKARFLSATSHDLSQPLHAQGFFLDALGRMLDTPDQQALFENIRASWRAQKDMLDDLVNITRLDGGLIQPTPEAVAFIPLITQIRNELQPQADRRDIDIHIEGDAPEIISDSGFCRRILSNIMSNAVKFTRDGSTVTITITQHPDTVEVSVQDEGPGIPDTQRDAVFQPAYRIDARDIDGSGLGLSIVSRLADTIGVDVEMDTPSTGYGLEVRLTFPIAGVLADQMESGTPLPIRVKSVAIVDDNDAVRNSMVMALSSWGVQVVATARPEELIRIMRLQEELPDLLLIDNRLADGRTGADCISSLRNFAKSDIPAILMTGDTSPGEAVSQLPFVTFAPKPIPPDVLHSIVSGSEAPAPKPIRASEIS